MNVRRADFPASPLAAILAALALAFGAAACGDSDDDGGASASPSREQPASTDGVSASEQKKIAAVMPFLRERYNATDGPGFCSKLTREGKREMREYAQSIPQFATLSCGPFMTKLTKRIIASGGAHRPVRIRKIAVDGDKASVTMQGGLAGIRSIATYTLVKEDGEWKLDDPASGAATRRVPQKYLQN